MRTCNTTTFKIQAISCVLKVPSTAKITDTQIKANRIIKKICKYLLIDESALKGTTQIKDVIDARFIAIHFLFVRMPELGHERIGKIFNRDRSSVYYALNKVQNWQSDKKFKKKFDLIESVI